MLFKTPKTAKEKCSKATRGFRLYFSLAADGKKSKNLWWGWGKKKESAVHAVVLGVQNSGDAVFSNGFPPRHPRMKITAGGGYFSAPVDEKARRMTSAIIFFFNCTCAKQALFFFGTTRNCS
jgi:hypothetical protein